MEISKSQIKKLRKIAQKISVQSEFHQANITKYYQIMADVARAEFIEDNKHTLNSFLSGCFNKALND